jgi:hypothetical protein
MRRSLFALVLVLTACGGDSTSSDSVACDDLWAEGADTDTAIKAGDEQGCTDTNGELRYDGHTFETCSDGRTLYWNDQGWGYSDDTWHRHTSSDLVAPDTERTACTT